MNKQIVIAGGGIGGLATALAVSKAGWSVALLERAAGFGEVGAGIQLGPNVVKLLFAWGLEPAFRRVAAFPQALQVRNATTGAHLGRLRLGARTQELYGAPYATIHRADMHQLLVEAVQACSTVQLHLGQRVAVFTQDDAQVEVQTQEGLSLQAQVLIGADGLWSVVRQQLLQDGPPRVSGHLAYRAMVRQQDLPERLRSQVVTAWLGPRMHVVQYPVRCGEWLNVVGIVHGAVGGEIDNWDHSANAADLRSALSATCADVQDLVGAIDHWRLWPLCDREPMRGAHEHAQGRVALLGDAAHPMRPYMAQGAGMALEDASCLQEELAREVPVSQALRAYAQRRWHRNARVQERSIRNGDIFHATGPMQWGRDLAMRTLGEKLLDVPWLYQGPDN